MKPMQNFLIHIFGLMLSTAAIANDDDWVSYYYQSPSPERFVEEVMILSQNGYLGDEQLRNSLGVFLSQVIAANSDKVTDWMNQLPDLGAGDTETLHFAMWLADTPETKSYFRSIGQGQFTETSPPNILELKPDSPAVLDMWWAYFFATGDEEPIRLIVTAFNFDEHEGALDAYATSEKTKKDEQNALYEAIFDSALWSLENNMRQHTKVAEIGESIFWERELTQPERLWLGVVLVKALPDKYKMTKVEGGRRIERVE